MYRKNTATQYIYFGLINSTSGAALTGATVTAYRALDGAAQASATGTTTELGNGQYRFNLSQADTNANNGSYLFTATNAIPVEKTVVFTAADPTDATAFGISQIDAAISSRLAPTVSGRTLDVTATGSIAYVDSVDTVDTVVQNVGVDTIAASAISSGSIAAGALNGKGDWSTQTSVDTLAGYVDTEVAAIKAKTDNLPVDPADASDIAASFSSLTGLVNTLTGYVDTEVAAIKAKTDNLPVDPADASDIAASFATVNSTLATIAGYVDTEVAAIKAKTDLIPADIGSVLVAANVNQRTVAVTGSNHVAADVHEFQPGVITAGDFAAGAIDANALAADAATEVANAVAATQALSRLDSMIESDGSGQFRFDTIALSMAPAGGGGGGGTDWTSDERTAIRSILGVPTSGTTPTDPSVGILDTIRDTVGSIGLNVYPVSASTPERVNGTTLTFYLDESRSVSIATDFTLTSMTLEFVVEDSRGNDIYTVANASITKSSQTATIPITSTVTGSLGQYNWSLRDITTGNSVIARGVLSVQNAASIG